MVKTQKVKYYNITQVLKVEAFPVMQNSKNYILIKLFGY